MKFLFYQRDLLTIIRKNLIMYSLIEIGPFLTRSRDQRSFGILNENLIDITKISQMFSNRDLYIRILREIDLGDLNNGH